MPDVQRVLAALRDGDVPSREELERFIDVTRDELERGLTGADKADAEVLLGRALAEYERRYGGRAVQADRAHPLAGQRFPVDSLREAAPHLRRPFTPAAVKWKVQNNLDNGGIVVAYIDARLVVDRLNMVIPHAWSERIEQVPGTKVYRCELTVDGITHVDVGEGGDGGRVSGPKMGYSDALKRAAVKFGIGVSVYALPQVTLQFGDAANQLRSSRNKQGKPVGRIDSRTLESLQKGYEKWLVAKGIDTFGPPLDHGDTGWAQGADDEPESVDAEPLREEEQLQPLPDDHPAIVQARKVYDDLRAADPMKMPPGMFQTELARVAHDEDMLQAFIQRLVSLIGSSS